jgi:response regulator RpfG family c-di-GMP phosphodiesterase
MSDRRAGNQAVASPTTRSARPNVLVVDDEPAIRAYFCDRLAEHAPYRCTGVASPDEALMRCKADTVDVAVLALEMPEHASMRLARRLRQEVADVPVVLITSGRSFDAVVEAMRIGIFDYLPKPFEMSELVDAVDRAAAWRGDALHARRHPDDLMRQVADRTAHLSQAFARHHGTSSAELDVLLESLSLGNPESLAHARRVSELSVPVASALGLGGPALRIIEQAALLHDLGKMAISDAVTPKHGPRTADEMAILRRHAQIGHDIAVAAPGLRHAAEIVLAAHERYDGSGFPRGLPGEAIPIGARVIAAVDTFDALTSACRYRDPNSIERANAELVRGAGSRFDPDVVTAWLQCLDALPAMADRWEAPETWQSRC